MAVKYEMTAEQKTGIEQAKAKNKDKKLENKRKRQIAGHQLGKNRQPVICTVFVHLDSKAGKFLRRRRRAGFPKGT